MDARPLADWYADFSTALLLLGIEDKVSTATAEDARYQFASTIEDTAFGGYIGPTLRYDHVFDATGTGPILKPSAWSDRPAQLRRGGLSLVTFDVGPAGATLSVDADDTRVTVIRHVP